MSSRSAFVKKLRAVVLEHYSDEQFGVSELVEKFGMSRSQIHRKLKAANGKSISQFIREVRLDEAMKLLHEDDYTASEVSFMVGFNSPTYFSTCFHEYFGFPPGEAKYHELTDLPSSDLVRKPGRNKRVVIWLVIITTLVISVFVFNYASEDSSPFADDVKAKPKTIAVLPFKNWSGDPELEYVSDGMTDAVITRLSGISDIDRVVPFTSIISYKKSDKSTKAIARELNVEYILEGNFKLSGDHVMSNLNLIEVESNEFLWSLEYSGQWKTDQIFEMQAAVAENVAENMKANITESEKSGISYVPTDNEEAYATFLQAGSLFQLLDDEGMSASLPLYEKAISLDSTYIEPYMGLANNYSAAGTMWGLMNQDEAWAISKNYFEEALRLDGLDEGHYYEEIMAYYCHAKFLYELDFDCFEKFIEVSMEQLPNNYPYHFFCGYFAKTGRHALAMEYRDKSVKSDPIRHYHQLGKGIHYYFLEDYEKTKQFFSVLDPHYINDYYYLIETAKYYYYMGEFDKSRKQLNYINSKFQSRPPIVIWLNAAHSFIDQDVIKQTEYLDILKEMYNENMSGSPAWFISLYYIDTGDVEKGFDWLNRSYERREVELSWFKEEPVLRPIKSDRRYIELYNKMGWQRFEVLPELSD